MGLTSRLRSVVAAPRLRADSAYVSNFFSGADMGDSWMSSLTAAGIQVTPDLAMTLSAYYCGVTTIAYDLATLPCQAFKVRSDGGKDKVQGRSYNEGGISDLAYKLRWAPNDFMTATEYTLAMTVQWLMRDVAYAEIIDGPTGFLQQLLPRHPDRVTPERLSSGRLRYKLTEANGRPRYLTQDEMHVVRGISLDGISRVSRTSYGAGALGNALMAERAAGKFFSNGMTSAVVATYKGAAGAGDDEWEDALHKSITRYASGVENNFGVLLVPDDVTINNLGLEPEKAQMMLAREWGAREVARLLRMPPHKLMIQGTTTYASQVQSATDYVVGCLRPIAHTFEQAIQRDLVLAKDTYFVEYQLAELLRGDPAARAAYYTAAIQNRWMRPSEVRLEENLNPDAALDKLSEGDNRPGQTAGAKTGSGSDGPAKTPASASKATYDAMLRLNQTATRCVRRERMAIDHLAKKHASDPAAWQASLREFYGTHAGFIAEQMRIDPRLARGYAAQHGSEFELKGVTLIEGQAGLEWERFEADELAGLALDDIGSIDGWFNRRLVDPRLAQTHVSVPVQIANQPPAISVDARTSVAPTAITVQPAAVTVPVQVAAPAVTVQPADVVIAKGAVQVDARTSVHVPPAPKSVKKTIKRDKDGQIASVTEELG